MKWQHYIITLTLLQHAWSIETKNNACRSIEAYHIAGLSSKCTYNPDVLSNFTSIVERRGYNLEKHQVTTTDGYILNIFRISSPSVSEKKYPIFILHGIVINSESWVDTGDRSIAFNLVERGYDVWVGTIRGTINANNHTTLTINDPEYWNFNLDTLAKEDVSVQLNFIASTTHEKILIISHSMGTTLSFMYTSEYQEEANQVVKGIVALAPVAYLNGIILIDLVRPVVLLAMDVLHVLNIKGLLYQEDLVHRFLIDTCKIIPEVCYATLSTIPGVSIQIPPEDLLLFLSYWPSGVSIFQLKHYLQISGSKRFQKYDYGKIENLITYGSDIPPVYNLSNIQVPVCLFYGKHDLFYTKELIARLISELGDSVKYETAVPIDQKPIYDFSHMDFLNSENLNEFLYSDLFERIASYFG